MGELAMGEQVTPVDAALAAISASRGASRRRFILAGATAGAGLALGSYVKPGLSSFGIPRVLAFSGQIPTPTEPGGGGQCLLCEDSTSTPTSTPTNTPTNTATPTDTPTNTPTSTPTDTPTSTPTNTSTPTATSTPVGNQGCSLGFWKQGNPTHNGTAWPSPYLPTQDFDATFGVNIFNPNKTLMDALNLGGGATNNLARQAVAALLNAAHPTIHYPIEPVSAVIAAVQAAVAGGASTIATLGSTLDTYNNLHNNTVCE